MGNATREALTGAREILVAHRDEVTLQTADDLFAAARVIGESHQLRNVLSDPSMDGSSKSALVSRLFGTLSPTALAVLVDTSARRWSKPSQFLSAVQELGIRAAAISAPKGTDVESELFSFGEAIEGNSELELALRSRLVGDEPKLALVEALIGSKASAQTLAIVRQLVHQSRIRSMRVALRFAASVVASEAGLIIANVTTAKPLTAPQLDRLRTGLAARYGANLSINETIDASVVGGLRVQLGDDVIDGSVSRRLAELRQRLAS